MHICKAFELETETNEVVLTLTLVVVKRAVWVIMTLQSKDTAIQL
jgi:hypothetical protein